MGRPTINTPDGKRTCSRCGVQKPLSEFYRRANGEYRSPCKSCASADSMAWKRENADSYKEKRARYRQKPEVRSAERDGSRRWRSENPETFRNMRLKYDFGITLADYNQILAAQGGGCAICGQVERSGKNLAVDHEHETGKVRGLLCTKCNIAIGNLMDDPELCIAAALYLLRQRNLLGGAACPPL